MRKTFLISSAATVLSILVLGALWRPAFWLLLLALPLIVMGLYDMQQRRHTIRRNFPLIGRMRWLMEKLRPFVRQYFIESDTDGVPINRMFRDIVYQRAKTVRESVAFGSRLDVYSNGYEWMGHSISAITVDDVGINQLRVPVGGPDCRQPYEASILNISAMSFGALSSNAVQAMNLGARTGGFAQNTGEGGISRYHLQHGGDLVWQIGTGYFGCRLKDGGFCRDQFRENAARDQVRMIELKLSQGAKPGHGGILPANKNTDEIAAARGVTAHTQVDSPPGHSAFDSPRNMMHFIAELRELSGGKPIGIKLAIGRESEFVSICKAMVATGIKPDFITVDGGEGGTGAAPLEYANSVGMPLREALVFVDNCLNGFGLREDIRLVASGKIFTAFHLVKHLALGADLVNSGRGMMLAAGCVHSLICNTNHCPSGVATQDPELVRGLVVSDKAPRVARFHRKTLMATADLIASAGLHHTAELNRTHIFRRIDQFRVARYDEIFPYLTAGCLLGDDIPEKWTVHMDESDIDCFFPRKNLTRVEGESETVHHHDRGASIVNALLAAFLLGAALLNPLATPAAADVGSAQANMSDRSNPLLELDTANGAIFVELFPTAAPQNVSHFLELVQMPDQQTTAEPADAELAPETGSAEFLRVVPGTLIQAGFPALQEEQELRPLEINASGLGLAQQPLLDANGRPHPWLNIADAEDFRQQVLVPLYRDLGIRDREALAARQEEVLSTLQDMNLLQARERLGYRYDNTLPSRRPAQASVLMVNDGPEGNSSGFFILLTDAPWMTGKYTVVGQVVSGMEIVMQINRRLTASSENIPIRLRQAEDGPATDRDNQQQE